MFAENSIISKTRFAPMILTVNLGEISPYSREQINRYNTKQSFSFYELSLFPLCNRVFCSPQMIHLVKDEPHYEKIPYSSPQVGISPHLPAHTCNT